MGKKTDITTNIILMTSAVVIISFAAFSFYINRLQYHSLSDEVTNSVESAGTQAAQSIANWINGRAALTEMAADAVGHADDAQRISALKNTVLEREFISTYFGNKDGGFIEWPHLPEPEGYDPRERPWYQQAMNANALILTEPYIDSVSGDLTVSAAVPVKVNGNTIGVTGSDFSLKALVSMIKAIKLDGHGFAFLVDGSGKIIVHPDSTLVSKTLSDAFPTSTPSITSEMSETTFRDTEYLVSFMSVPGLPSASWYVGLAIDKNIAYQSVGRLRIAAAVATLLAVITMIASLFIFLKRLIVRPVSEMTQVMERLAEGDLSVKIPAQDRRDQIGSMAAAVAVFQRNAIERSRLECEADASRSLNEQERRDREDANAAEAARLQDAMDQLASGLGHLADGDLGYRISVPFAANLDRLRSDFNSSVSKLHKTLSIVGTNANTIDASANEIRIAADNLARRTEQQAATIEETSAALEQITVTVKDSAHRADQVGELVKRTKSGAESSGHVVDRAVEAMQGIETSSHEIGNIISVIDEITFQTNLLALNAGVEAARAGDAGKGFAVVAQEVRELAQRCANAATEIKALIAKSSSQVAVGVDLVGATGEALKEIVSGIQEISGHISAIVIGTREQSVSLQAVTTSVNAIDQATQQNAAMVEEQNAASHNLATEAAGLREALSRFDLAEKRDAKGVSSVTMVA